MKKLSLTLLSVLIAMVGFSQSPCSQLNASFTLTQNINAVTLTNTSTFPTSSNPTGSYATIDWGDNNWGNPNPTANHTYANPGSYNVIMYVSWWDSSSTNQNYCSDTAYQTVNISLPPCNASISSVNNGNGSYTFTANNLGGGTNTYFWDFGDGSTATGSPASHTYTASGNYTVTLTSSGSGCTHTSTAPITYWNGQINCTSLQASFSHNGSGYTHIFYNTSTSPSYPYVNVGKLASWDFGDGTTATDQNYLSHTYTNPGTYTVIMTNNWVDSTTFYNNTVLCTKTDTQQVTITPPPPPANLISGSIVYDSLLINNPVSFKVWLIQQSYDSAVMSNMLTAVDSLITSPGYPWANYQFNNIANGTYYVKARVAPGTTNPGLIPTYHQSTATWSNATSFYHNGGSTINKHILMISGTPASGPGFIGGNVSQGAGKGTNTGVANLLILLRDANANVIASAYTDANGAYSFGSIPNGTYTIYPEEMNYQTTPSASLTIGSGTNVYNMVDFEKNSRTIKPKPTGITDVVNNVFSIYPNPSKGIVNIHWKNGISGEAKAVVTDMAGRIVYQHSLTTRAKAVVNLTGLNAGVYFLKIQTEKAQHTERIVIE